MTARSWFIVGARLIGIWALLQSFASVAWFISMTLDDGNSFGTPWPGQGAWSVIIMAVLQIGAGLYLLIGAGHLAGLLFSTGCPICGYSMQGLASPICPECGATRRGAPAPPAPRDGSA